MTHTTTLDADMLGMLRGSLRHVLTEESDRSLADRLAELGWDDVIADDEATALRTLFEIKGETLSSTDALGPTLTRALADLTGDPSLGASTFTFPSPFGSSVVDGDALRIDALAFSQPGDRPVIHPVGDRLAICPPAAVTGGPLGGTDDTLRLIHLTATIPTSSVGWVDGDAWSRLLDRGRWLLACELVGIARHVIAAAVEYTKQRVQYGKPIGVFQALQHRLASAHSMMVGAGHLAAEAGIAGDGWSAMVAKCMAGQTTEFACTQAQQCYGAIGFTWEHEFHRYLRRAYVLDQLLGDWRSLEHEIGMRLQATGTVPRIGDL